MRQMRDIYKGFPFWLSFQPSAAQLLSPPQELEGLYRIARKKVRSRRSRRSRSRRRECININKQHFENYFVEMSEIYFILRCKKITILSQFEANVGKFTD